MQQVSYQLWINHNVSEQLPATAGTYDYKHISVRNNDEEANHEIIFFTNLFFCTLWPLLSHNHYSVIL